MKRIRATFAALIVAAACSPHASAQNSADLTASIVVGGVTRTYVYHVPPTLGKSVALVLSFHGHGGDGATQAKLTNFDALSDARGFIVIYPDGIHRGWNDGREENAGADDIAFTKALIADFSKRFPIDPKRIYATGFSNGATFTEVLGCKMSETFAAIAPVSGYIPQVDAPSCSPKRAPSIVIVGGTADPIMPYVGGEIHLFGKDRGLVLSAQQTISFWMVQAKCSQSPLIEDIVHDGSSDGTSVTHAVYQRCAPGRGVELYTVVDGGHTWPGGPQYAPRIIVGKASTQLDASRVIVDFLLAHPLP